MHSYLLEIHWSKPNIYCVRHHKDPKDSKEVYALSPLPFSFFFYFETGNVAMIIPNFFRSHNTSRTLCPPFCPLSQLNTSTFSLFCGPASLIGSFPRLLALKSCSAGVKPVGKKDWLAVGSSFHVHYLIASVGRSCLLAGPNKIQTEIGTGFPLESRCLSKTCVLLSR